MPTTTCKRSICRRKRHDCTSRECLEAGGFEVSGAFLLQNDPEALLVAASGEILLGDFGRLAAEGGLRLVKEHRSESGTIVQQAGAAGSLTIIADLGIPNLIDDRRWRSV